MNSTMMRAVAMLGTAYNVTVINVPKPTIQNTTDAIVRVTASAICGSDLHLYHQPLGSAENPFMIGHEALGYVSEVGSGVNALSVGDYVVIPDNADDGKFAFGPDLPDSYGSGTLGGCQAEYVRIPHADDTLIPVPVTNSTNSSKVIDYLFVSDIFATGWTSLDFSGFQPGDSVAVFGAGPVGLLAAYSAMLRGASKVYSVDHVQARLDVAASIGAIPINFNVSDPADQILALEPNGVTRSVDCVGFEAVNVQGQYQAGIVTEHMIRVTARRGGMGVVGVYNSSPNVYNETMATAITDIWTKGLSLGSGIVLPLEHATGLVNLVNSGRASPSFIVSARIGIEQAPEYYARFERHEEVKVVIEFP